MLATKDLKLNLLDKVIVAFLAKIMDLIVAYRSRVSKKMFSGLGTDYDEHTYGTHRFEQLQFFSGDEGKIPIVYIHGGGWLGGCMRSVAVGHEHFIEAKHPIFNLNYPLSPENPFPQALISCLNALKWLKQNHPDVKQVHMMGDSAGGNLAAMVGLMIDNPETLKPYGKYIPDLCADDFPTIKSIVSIYGALDRLSLRDSRIAQAVLRGYAGQECMEEEVSNDFCFTPLDIDWKSCPPLYLAAAQNDPLTVSSKLASLYFQESSENLIFKVYPDVGHGFYEEPNKAQSLQMKKDIVAFFEDL